jgi:GAF domain-containing protein
MDRSIHKLPDPISESAHGERRRSVRQKLHTPVYASFNGPEAGMVVDLSELSDLHEDGFAIQTGQRLEMNRAVALCLDLPETRNYVHGSGQVIWSDDSGRGGIRFSALPDSSRKILREWLFANLLIACSNHAARTEQRSRREAENENTVANKPAAARERGPVVSIADGRGARASSELELELELESVRGKVRELGDDIDTVLQVITERALSLTESSGAAMAFLTDDKMTCRARSGEPAPPLGATLDTQQGLSGECVRTGRLVSCEDTENDRRVDADVCRSLGIGSLMAAPIVSGVRVIGVLEVLSPHPRSLKKSYGVVLDQLVEMIPRLHDKSGQPETAPFLTAELTAVLTADRVTERAADKLDVVPVTASSSISDAIPSGSSESDSVSAIRDAFRDEAGQRKADHQKNEMAHEVPQPVPQLVSEENSDGPARPSGLHYRALLGLSLVVALAALTYVFAPVAKNWAGSPQGARWLSMRSTKAINVAEAASAQPTGLRSAASRSVNSGSADPNLVDPGSAGHSLQPKSLQEVQKLADTGDPDAQWQMGVRYHDGQGVGQDDAEAVRWFELAAEQGYVAAQGALGAYYWRGRGVPADLSKAYFWSAIAMAQGDEMSKSRIEGLSSQMTRAQISVARQQAEDWISSHTRREPSGQN